MSIDENWGEAVQPTSLPNLTPMIDVVFILLLFFMTTTVFQSQAVSVDKAKASTASLYSRSIPVTVTQDGTVYYQKSKIGIPALMQIVDNRLQKYPDLAVIVTPDKRTSAEDLMKVIDHVKKAGASRVAIGVGR